MPQGPSANEVLELVVKAGGRITGRRLIGQINEGWKLNIPQRTPVEKIPQVRKLLDGDKLKKVTAGGKIRKWPYLETPDYEEKPGRKNQEKATPKVHTSAVKPEKITKPVNFWEGFGYRIGTTRKQLDLIEGACEEKVREIKRMREEIERVRGELNDFETRVEENIHGLEEKIEAIQKGLNGTKKIQRVLNETNKKSSPPAAKEGVTHRNSVVLAEDKSNIEPKGEVCVKCYLRAATNVKMVRHQGDLYDEDCFEELYYKETKKRPVLVPSRENPRVLILEGSTT